MLPLKLLLGTLVGLCLTTQIAQANSVKIHNHTCMCACVRMHTLGAVADGRKKCTNAYNTATSSNASGDIIKSVQFWLYEVKDCKDRTDANQVAYRDTKMNRSAGTYTYRMGVGWPGAAVGTPVTEMSVQGMGDAAKDRSIQELNKAREKLRTTGQCTFMEQKLTREALE